MCKVKAISSKRKIKTAFLTDFQCKSHCISMVMTYFHKQRPCRLPTCSRKRDACRRRFKKKEKETAGRQAPIDIIHGLCPENEPAEKPKPGIQTVRMIYFLTNFLTSDDVPWSIIRI